MNSIEQYLDHSSIHVWELYSARVNFDFKQTLEEGKDVAYLKDLVDAVSGLPLGPFRDELADSIWQEMQKAEQQNDYPYNEPSELEKIKAWRPKTAMLPKLRLSEEQIYDKVLGAWIGRTFGCLLGKPIEGIRSYHIEALAKKQGNFPIQSYLKYDAETLKKLEIKGREKYAWIDNISNCLPDDDDTNYTVMAAMKIVGEHGRNFTPQNVMDVWVACQGKDSYCTAERVAFLNSVAGLKAPVTATYKNPYREWIGAQIRADYYGYINPGNPELAAEMAWRDASISHTKNGIYGAMFVAAMLAGAAVCNDIIKVVEAGLSQIPAGCRLAEQTRELLLQYKKGEGKDSVFGWIKSQYDETQSHHWCHTISNALIVVASLLYGEKKYGKSICMSVEIGFDTDCNAATVGSILGMMLGTAGIEEQWTKGLPTKLKTGIFGYQFVEFKELAKKTIETIKDGTAQIENIDMTVMI